MFGSWWLISKKHNYTKGASTLFLPPLYFSSCFSPFWGITLIVSKRESDRGREGERWAYGSFSFSSLSNRLAPLCSSLAVLVKIKEDIKRSTVAETQGERRLEQEETQHQVWYHWVCTCFKLCLADKDFILIFFLTQFHWLENQIFTFL